MQTYDRVVHSQPRATHWCVWVLCLMLFVRVLTAVSYAMCVCALMFEAFHSYLWLNFRRQRTARVFASARLMR